MNYNWEFAQKIDCDVSEKKQCMALVSEIITLAYKARRYGLLSLVEYTENCPHFILKKGLQLVVDGVKPQIVKDILELYIVSGNFSGKELLQRCIMLEGVTAIQGGLNPKIVRELLLSFFGEDGYRAYHKEFENSCDDKLELYIKSIEDSPKPPPVPSKLNALITDLEDQEIQQCLKEINTVDLATAVKGMGGKAQLKIFNNLPKRGASYLHEVLDQMATVKKSDVKEAQEKIETIIADLNSENAIQLPD